MLATHVFVLKGAVLTVSVFVWTADLRSVHQTHIVYALCIVNEVVFKPEKEGFL